MVVLNNARPAVTAAMRCRSFSFNPTNNSSTISQQSRAASSTSSSSSTTNSNSDSSKPTVPSSLNWREIISQSNKTNTSRPYFNTATAFSVRQRASSFESGVTLNRQFSSMGAAKKAEVVEPTKEDEEKAPEEKKKKSGAYMTPPELVHELDEFIIGQAEAKKAMASAIRYRWRRKQLDEKQREDCNPRNILMIGPTGCGKTEIARRLAKIVDAPFVIAEATKFTEVGFHGRDIESVLRDLMEAGLKMQRKKLEEEYKPLAMQMVEEKVLEALMGELSNKSDRITWIGHLRKGWLDDRIITVEVPVQTPGMQMPGMGGAGGGAGFGGQGDYGDFGGGGDKDMRMLGGSGGRGPKMEKRKLSIKEAKKKLLRAELDQRIQQEDLVQKALESVEQDGIIFLDEIDKIVSPKGSYGPDASSEGVQRDLLPIIEGTTVQTKYGNIRSDHVLFVCAGSFHAVKPSDMLAELQGRLPVKMKLHPLTEGDFYRILTEPAFGIIKQNVALLGTEGVEVVWTEEARRAVAFFATEMNTYIENIGARRLHTIVEKVTDDLSYNAAQYSDTKVEITKEFVHEKLKDIEIDKSAKGLL